MNRKAFALAAGLVLIFSLLETPSFAQDNKAANEYLQQQLEEELRRKQDALTEDLEARKQPMFLDLRFFVPESDDAWSLSIMATGGILGGTRLLAAINSDGNVLCHPRDAEFKARLAPKVQFDEIVQLAKQEMPLKNIHRVVNKETRIACHDCSFEFLSYNYRENGLISTGTYAVNRLTKSQYQLYSKVLEASVCRE